MNRNEEYRLLLEQMEAEPVPSALDHCVERTQARARRHGRAHGWGATLASLGGLAAAFALAVNLSVPFAMACKGIPVLKELAAAVALSPSLKSAVENDFIQYVGREQTENGVTLRLEYLILDRRQINFFYTVSGGDYDSFHVWPSIRGADGEELHGYGMTSGTALPGTFCDFTANFQEDFQVPEELILTCEVEGRRTYRGEAESSAPRPAGEVPAGDPDTVETAAVFTFPLTLDRRLIGPGETLELEKWITAEDQLLCLQSLEIDPTHARLKITFDEANTAWCQGLDFYLTDSAGNRYESGSRSGTNGILVATGSSEEQGMVYYYLESPYFTGKGPYTLHITGAAWLDKGKEWVSVDLDAGKAQGLPDGAGLVSAVREGPNVILSFSLPDPDHQLFTWAYRDPEGVERHLSSESYYTRENEDGTTTRTSEFRLPDYPFSTVEMKLHYTRTGELAPPVEVELN